MVYLSSGESVTHGAYGLSILVSFLLHLQQLSGLDQRLQSLLSSTRHQTFVSEPLLQLAHIVPEHKHKNAHISEMDVTRIKE